MQVLEYLYPPRLNDSTRVTARVFQCMFLCFCYRYSKYHGSLAQQANQKRYSYRYIAVPVHTPKKSYSSTRV